jgi:hypothetical protein
VLYFEMLSGKRPYVGKTPTEVMGKHLNAPVPLLPTHLSAYQPVIDVLMAKRPTDRYANATAARAAILAPLP